MLVEMPTRFLEEEIRECDRRLAELRQQTGADAEAERQQIQERRRITVIALRKALEDLGFTADEIDIRPDTA
jgi:hypothetical protein